jgi:hypothetical protein
MAFRAQRGEVNQLELRGVLASSHPHGRTQIRIDAGVAADAVGGHTPTTYLREGLILTKITASGMYGHFDNGASDGRQLPVSAVVLAHDVDLSEWGSSEDVLASAYYFGVFYSNLLLVGSGFAYTNCQRLITLPSAD